MPTTLRTHHAAPAPEPSRDTALIQREPPRSGLLTRRSGPWLLVGLILALLVWLTNGGGPGLYEAVYLRAEGVWHHLVSAPGAPLPFLDRGKARAARFRLQGIVYSPAGSLAVINQANCAPGEKVTVKVGTDTEVIRCVEVHPRAVWIETADGTFRSLHLQQLSEGSESVDPSEPLP
jgi:hypothetical protein